MVTKTFCLVIAREVDISIASFIPQIHKLVPSISLEVKLPNMVGHSQDRVIVSNAFHHSKVFVRMVHALLPCGPIKNLHRIRCSKVPEKIGFVIFSEDKHQRSIFTCWKINQIQSLHNTWETMKCRLSLTNLLVSRRHAQHDLSAVVVLLTKC